MSEPLQERSFGAVTILFGEQGGKYPSGNSMLVQGAEESLLIDPSMGVVARKGNLPHVDRVVNSHCHEDHVAGNHLFPDASWHLHEADLPGIRSLDGFMEIFGYPEPIHSYWRKAVVEQFHFTPREDALPYRDGDVFDLGGGVRVRVVHAPGHTRGHCLLFAEPDDVVFLGDVDLSSFGPYYGDAWSSLEDFERTLVKVREIDAAAYATFHHVGVLEGREAFLERFERFNAKIQDREQRLLAYLAEPHTIEEVVEHRFVFRPGDDVAFADGVERRSMQLHIDRLIPAGAVKEVEPGRYQAS